MSTYFPTTSSLSGRVAGHVSIERIGCYELDVWPWSEVALVGQKWVLNLLLRSPANASNNHLFSVLIAPAAVWDGRGWVGLTRDSGGFEWGTVRVVGAASPARASSLLLFSSASRLLIASLLPLLSTDFGRKSAKQQQGTLENRGVRPHRRDSNVEMLRTTPILRSWCPSSESGSNNSKLRLHGDGVKMTPRITSPVFT